ncbi:c-type cytochrome [Undibacterium sp. RuRC25W]|uniref:c-type cytochrome n=1 Tax=Undibacterium sp. RuRC25W TaxID=3413047 RepID=UPI003BF3A15C
MKKMILIATSAMFLSAFSVSAFASGNAEHGKAIVEKNNCAACHGNNFNSPIDPSYPKLAGQHQDYLVQALKGYQRGVDGPNGRGNATMSAQAKTLSHDDILDVAAYLHSLPGSLVLKK